MTYILYPIQSDFYQELHITPSQPSMHGSIPWSHSASNRHNTLNISPPGFFSSTRNFMFTCFSVFYQEWFSEVNTSVYRNNFITQHCISIMEYGLVHGWGMVQQQLVCIYFHDHWSSPEAVYVDLLLNSHTSYSKLIIGKVIEEKVSVRWRIFIYESILY